MLPRVLLTLVFCLALAAPASAVEPNGALIRLTTNGYTYRIVGTRTVSFRSTKSLAAQAAAVPGRPGVRATQAMITLSTCRTPEDHAEGNYWSDEFGNPEHRIDKIGKLVAVGPA